MEGAGYGDCCLLRGFLTSYPVSQSSHLVGGVRTNINTATQIMIQKILKGDKEILDILRRIIRLESYDSDVMLHIV